MVSHHPLFGARVSRRGYLEQRAESDRLIGRAAAEFGRRPLPVAAARCQAADWRCVSVDAWLRSSPRPSSRRTGRTINPAR